MTDYIGYEALTQAAMRGVIREALRQVANESGPPGEHHFYITFQSKAPGVKMADHLVQRFPDEMTIVIQHQFWDLEVEDGHFEIVLKFAGVPQHISIPFAAVTRFVDPAVNFALSFEPVTGSADAKDVVAPTTNVSQEAQPETMADETPEEISTVVNLDAFRRK